MAIDPLQEEMRTVYQYLTAIVAPRPIAFVSSVNHVGQVNLSPFSFFNVVSIDPPVMVFAPTLGRGNIKKDTLRNVEQVPEVVIHLVSDGIVDQMSLTSANYPYEVSELEMAGFTRVESEMVAPPRIAEALVAMECLVTEVKSFGSTPGAGSMVLCRLLKLHIDQECIDDNFKPRLQKLHHIGRLGGNLYCRAFGKALFELNRPEGPGMGMDALPDYIKNSQYLTGNDLGKLAQLHRFPDEEEMKKVTNSEKMKIILNKTRGRAEQREKMLCEWCKQLLTEGQEYAALAVLMLING